MTTTPLKARCPQCGNTETFPIFIRSDDDLICRSCARPSSEHLPFCPSCGDDTFIHQHSRREGPPHASYPSHEPSRRAGRRR